MMNKLPVKLNTRTALVTTSISLEIKKERARDQRLLIVFIGRQTTVVLMRGY